MAQPSPFPPIRRVVTGHDLTSKAIILEDKRQTREPFTDNPGSLIHTKFFQTDSFPSDIGVEFRDLVATDSPMINANGTSFVVVDIPPGAFFPLHRTMSLDYVMVLKGSVVCELDDGKRVTLHECDALIQRGTIHAWINDTDQWARMSAAVLSAKPVEIGNQKLMAGGMVPT